LFLGFVIGELIVFVKAVGASISKLVPALAASVTVEINGIT
jgi:hypothetical protein